MEINIFCITLTAIMAVLLVGTGVNIGRSDKRELDGDSDVRVYVPMRRRRGGGNNRHNKPMEIDDDSLAAVLRAMCTTGICPSNDEKAYLIEAADRLERKSDD